MTPPVPPERVSRSSTLTAKFSDGYWRSVIRILFVFTALLGLVLIGNEIFENIVSCNAGVCTKIHLSAMLWGVVLLSLGTLVLQKGDVSISLQQLVSSGNVVSGWFGRRASDRPPPTETPP